MSLFLIRWLFNAIINAMINAIFTGGVNHGVICRPLKPHSGSTGNVDSLKTTTLQHGKVPPSRF